MNEEPLYAIYRTTEDDRVVFKNGGRTFDNGYTLKQIRALNRHSEEIRSWIGADSNRVLFIEPLEGREWPDDPDLPPIIQES